MHQLSCIYVTKCPLETRNSLIGGFVFLKICEILVLLSIFWKIHLDLNWGRKQVFSRFPEKQMFSLQVSFTVNLTIFILLRRLCLRRPAKALTRGKTLPFDCKTRLEPGSMFDALPWVSLMVFPAAAESFSQLLVISLDFPLPLTNLKPLRFAIVNFVILLLLLMFLFLETQSCPV